MRYLFPILLCSCSIGGTDVWGGEDKVIEANGYKFKVIYTDERAEAYRQGAVTRPRAKTIFKAALKAMEEASGCTVEIDTMEGDVSLVEADLSC